MPIDNPPPPPKKGKGVHWRDHEVHRDRGHSSFMDLEVSSTSSMLHKADNERIVYADELWYKAQDFEEERKVVKAEFFRRLGDASGGAGSSSEQQNWNKLTAYSGLLGAASTLKPRTYEKDEGESDGHRTPTPPPSYSASPVMMRRSKRNSKDTADKDDRGSGRWSATNDGDSSRWDEDEGESRWSASFRRPSTARAVGLDDFRIHGLCGEGSFGRVMMATKIDTQKVYAMKVIRKELLVSRGEHTVAQAITEKNVLQQMASHPHPYVISLRYAFQTDDSIFLVMDLVGGGDLYQFLEAKGRLPEDWVFVYAAEVALALEHVHSHEVLFRDLKPENVMIGVDGHLKLTDFGLSKQLREEVGDDPLKGGLLSGQGNDSLTDKARTRTICGTPEYIAPEVLQGKPYHSSLDWWTYGCLVYEMVHGKAPFRSLDMGSLVQLITRCRIKFSSEYCSKTLEDLLRSLIKVDPDTRLGAPPHGAGQVKQHSFFKAMDWDALMRKEIPAPCALDDVYARTDGQMPTREKSAVKLNEEFGTFTGFDEGGDDAELQRMHSTMLRRVSRDSYEGGHGTESSDKSSSEVSVPGALSRPQRGSRESTTSTSPELGARETPTMEKRSRRRESTESLASSPAFGMPAHGLSLELTRTGAIWAISHSLLGSLGYNHVGKQPLLGRSMVDGASSLVESGDLAKFCGAFEKAQESLDEKLHMLPTAAAAATSGAIEDAETPKLPDVTVWLRTASNGRVCMQCSLEVAMLDASYRDTGGPAGIITLTMIDVTAAETKKEIVARRYELAYNEKAPDSVLADFFASWMKENTKAVPVPGTRRPSAEEYEGAPAGEDGSVAKKEGASSGAVLPGVRQPGDPYVRGDEISSGVRAYLERRRILVKAFPDLKFTMLEQTSQGDSVYTSWQWTGTHLGPYPCDNGEELSPSGARVHVHGISIDVFDRHTRIVDHSVFYDENAIRAQLEIKASASRGRDTRSIIRRAHNARKKLMQESSITVQLYLSVRKAQGGSSGAAVVGAMMRPVVSTAPRYSPMELTMMSTMEVYYASKATAHIGSFDTDGFCLCDGGESSSLEPIPVTSSSPSHSAQQASIVLYSHAFANIVDLPARTLLRANLHSILEPAMRDADPGLGARLASCIAKREPFHAVFEGRFDGYSRRDARGSAENSSRGSVAETGRSSAETGRSSAENYDGCSSSASSTATPGRILVIDVAPFVYERRLYWSVLLSDLSDDLELSNVDLDGRVRPSVADAISDAASSSTASRAAPAGAASGWAHHRPQGGAIPTHALLSSRANIAKRANRPGPKVELADIFVHCLPSSWCWFGCKMLQSVINTALHACNAALSLSDLKGEDAPLVWIAEGFTRLHGWSRNEVIGRNCRFLQNDASDPAAVHAMRRAISARMHTRVYIWNEDVAGDGFWSIVSISPGGKHDEQMPKSAAQPDGGAPGSPSGDVQSRYMMGVQHRLTKSEMRFIFDRVIAFRSAYWQRPSAVAISGEQLSSADVQWPSSAAQPPAPDQFKATLFKWRSDFVHLNGRGPTAEEATAMVAGIIATLQDEENGPAVDISG